MKIIDYIMIEDDLVEPADATMVDTVNDATVSFFEGNLASEVYLEIINPFVKVDQHLGHCQQVLQYHLNRPYG